MNELWITRRMITRFHYVDVLKHEKISGLRLVAILMNYLSDITEVGNSNNISKVYQCYRRGGEETTMTGGEKLKSI